MAFELVFSNGSLVGGFLGTRVSPPDVFGYSIDPSAHPGPVRGGRPRRARHRGLLTANMRRGRIGRRLVAVRGNERAAAAIGVSVTGAKLYAFGLGAAIAALGGCFLAFRQTTINYTQFAPFASIAIVVFVVIGGVGFVVGALAAAPFVLGGVGGEIVESLGLSANALNLFSGALLLVTLMANPNGIAFAQVQFFDRLRGRLRRGASPASTRPEVVPVPVRPRPAAALRIDDLTVRFGGVVAVDGVSFDVNPGEVLGLIGPNGAGKTTIIDAVTGFVRSEPGSGVMLDGVDLRGFKPVQRARHGLGRSFQSVELFDDMTVLENLLAASDDRSSRVYVTDLVRPERAIGAGRRVAHHRGLRPRDGPGSLPRSAAVRAAAAGGRCPHGRRPTLGAAPRRAGRRAQRRRVAPPRRGGRPAVARGRPRGDDDRARRRSRHGDLRSRGGPRLRAQDRRRSTGRGDAATRPWSPRTWANPRTSSAPWHQGPRHDPVLEGAPTSRSATGTSPSWSTSTSTSTKARSSRCSVRTGRARARRSWPSQEPCRRGARSSSTASRCGDRPTAEPGGASPSSRKGARCSWA